MKKIDKLEIKKLELQILDVIAEFCDENDLRYYLCGGTLLGAVRHKGFIPWDDDIDIMMPRDDYERFNELFPDRKEKDEFELISYNNGKSFYPFTKVVNNKTLIQEKYMDNNYQINIWVDVFPLDGMPADDIIIKKRYNLLKFWKSILLLIVSNPDKGTNQLIKVVKKILVPFFRHFDVQKVCKKMDKLSSEYSIIDSPNVGVFVWGYGPQEKMPREYLEQVEMEFEGKIYTVSKCWDYYLKSLYGDYMQLPPEDKRIYHGFEAMWKE